MNRFFDAYFNYSEEENEHIHRTLNEIQKELNEILEYRCGFSSKKTTEVLPRIILRKIAYGEIPHIRILLDDYKATGGEIINRFFDISFNYSEKETKRNNRILNKIEKALKEAIEHPENNFFIRLNPIPKTIVQRIINGKIPHVKILLDEVEATEVDQ
jgi:diadenosine tetraphosphate (Ap4A) HIT family hydrolase